MARLSVSPFFYRKVQKSTLGRVVPVGYLLTQSKLRFGSPNVFLSVWTAFSYLSNSLSIGSPKAQKKSL